MEKNKRLLLLLMVSVVLSLSSIFYLAMQNMDLRRDLYTMESQLQRSERKAQFYLERWNKEIDKRVYYYDRLVQISANREAAKALGNEEQPVPQKNTITKLYVYVYNDDSSKRYYAGIPLAESELIRRNLRYEGWYMPNEIPDSY